MAFMVARHGMWDISSQTRDGTCTPALAVQSLSHWTAREVLRLFNHTSKWHTESTPLSPSPLPKLLSGLVAPSRLSLCVLTSPVQLSLLWQDPFLRASRAHPSYHHRRASSHLHLKLRTVWWLLITLGIKSKLLTLESLWFNPSLHLSLPLPTSHSTTAPKPLTPSTQSLFPHWGGSSCLECVSSGSMHSCFLLNFQYHLNIISSERLSQPILPCFQHSVIQLLLYFRKWKC